MTMWAALLIVLAVFAFGDFMGVITKAKVPSLFVIMCSFLVLFMTKVIPANVMATAGLTQIAQISIALLLVNMGSSVELKQFKREWRTVACSALSMLIAIIGCLVLIPVIGRENVLVAGPVVNGGIVATTTVIQAATSKGLEMAAALAAFLYATQKFVGTLPASYFGLKCARRFLAQYREEKAAGRLEEANKPADTEAPVEKKQTFAERYDKYYTVYTCLAIGAACAYVASVVAKLTHGWIGLALGCMILGIVLRNVGLIPPNIMRTKGVSVGFFMFGSMCVIVPSLSKVDLRMLGSLGIAAVSVFALFLIGIYVAFKFLPFWKIVGDKDLSIGIAMCQTLGYPGTQLISDEIAKAVGETQDEIDYLSAKISTAYVIAWFTSVTILSVFVASIMANML